MFDNNAAVPGAQTLSRGLRIKLDMKMRRASLVVEYPAPTPRTGWAMGNVQQLEDGGVFIGWGTDGSFTELGPDGSVRLDARFAEGSVSYRAYRFELDARPKGRPATWVVQNGDGTMTVYVSWNGATDVATWQVVAGPDRGSMKPVTTARRTGFETAITVPTMNGYVSVIALDAHKKQVRSAAATPVRA
jgi:hypothetical protein